MLLSAFAVFGLKEEDNELPEEENEKEVDDFECVLSLTLSAGPPTAVEDVLFLSARMDVDADDS